MAASFGILPLAALVHPCTAEGRQRAGQDAQVQWAQDAQELPGAVAGRNLAVFRLN